LIGSVAAAVGLGGCGTGFSQLGLSPPAQIAAPSDQLPYAQIRQFGIAGKVVWLKQDSSWQLGVTVDVENRTGAPLTLDLAAATVELQSARPGERSSARAIAAGTGGLPGVVRLNIRKPIPVTLSAGEQRTFWIAFETVDRLPDEPRITIHIPAGPSPPIAIRLIDPTSPRPAQLIARSKGTGLMFGLVDHDFGEDAEIVATRLGLLHVMGPLRYGLGGEFGTYFVRSSGAHARAYVASAEIGVGWRPAPFAVGGFGAWRWTYQDFPASSGISDRWSPSLSLGLEFPSPIGPVIPGSFRVGVTRVFDNRVMAATALSLAIDLPLWRW
jgi:hypothetical protein